MVRVADMPKTQWSVCMYTAITGIVTAVWTKPKDGAKMVHKKGSHGFATTNKKCKQMTSATAN